MKFWLQLDRPLGDREELRTILPRNFEKILTRFSALVYCWSFVERIEIDLMTLVFSTNPWTGNGFFHMEVPIWGSKGSLQERPVENRSWNTTMAHFYDMLASRGNRYDRNRSKYPFDVFWHCDSCLGIPFRRFWHCDSCLDTWSNLPRDCKLTILTGNDPIVLGRISILGRILPTFSDLKPSVVACSAQFLETDKLYHPW